MHHWQFQNFGSLQAGLVSCDFAVTWCGIQSVAALVLGDGRNWNHCHAIGHVYGLTDLCCNVRFTRSSLHTIHDNAERITGSAKSGNKVFVQQDYHSLGALRLQGLKTNH
jgi:hypothetical protein